jgi:hypothetical protein
MGRRLALTSSTGAARPRHLCGDGPAPTGPRGRHRMSTGIASFSAASAFAALSKSPVLEQLNRASIGHRSRRRGGRHGLGLRDQQPMIAVREVPRQSSLRPDFVVDYPDPRNAVSVASASIRAIRAATEPDTESSVRTGATRATVRIAPRRPRGPRRAAGGFDHGHEAGGTDHLWRHGIACPGVARVGGDSSDTGAGGSVRNSSTWSPTGAPPDRCGILARAP